MFAAPRAVIERAPLFSSPPVVPANLRMALAFVLLKMTFGASVPVYVFTRVPLHLYSNEVTVRLSRITPLGAVASFVAIGVFTMISGVLNVPQGGVVDFANLHLVRANSVTSSVPAPAPVGFVTLSLALSAHLVEYALPSPFTANVTLVVKVTGLTTSASLMKTPLAYQCGSSACAAAGATTNAAMASSDAMSPFFFTYSS